MLRKRLMKRLSKSATDISSCRKNTYSTSPEEEAREFGSGHQPGRSGNAAGGVAEGKENDIDVLRVSHMVIILTIIR